MRSRPVAATFFVALCLLLCGMILRHQIAAHPLPPASKQNFEEEQMNFGQRFGGHQMNMGQRFEGDRQSSWMGMQGWQAATPSAAGQVHQTVQGQLTAMHAGDAPKAISYQSQFMRQVFGDPNRFERMIDEQYPEFGHCRQAHYGQVWTDKTEQHARVMVIVDGENGHHARGEYLLVREGGHFKIRGVDALRLPD